MMLPAAWLTTTTTTTTPPPAATPGSTQPVGSISKVYDNLQKLAGMSRSTKDGFPSDLPVEGNSGGSFLTMMSKSGLIFGVINIAGNFGTVFVDQAYWQCAIAGECLLSAGAAGLHHHWQVPCITQWL